MAQAGVGALDVFCWVTAGIAPTLSVWATGVAWYRRALGAGGRRPEPTVAALTCNAVWILFGLRADVRKHTAEPLWLNFWGAAFQAVYLVTFLSLCTREERGRANKPMWCAGIYLGVMLVLRGIIEIDRYKVLCTIAGLVSAATPLLTYTLLDEETLPPWRMSAFSMVQCFAWWVRAGMKPKGPDYYMGTQNGLGAFCSFVLLLLAWSLRYAHILPTAEDRGIMAKLRLRCPNIVTSLLFPPRVLKRHQSAPQLQEHQN